MNYYQKRNYKVKKPRDLRLLEIKSEDIKDVERLIKRIKRRSIMSLIVFPFILLVLSAGLFDSIKKSQGIDVAIKGAALIILFTYFIIIIRKIVGARLNNIVGAQYGIVKRVYSEKSSNKGRERYVDVDFPEEHSSIERIRYFWQIHFTLDKADFEEGDNVLVITFNGKKAYVVFVTNNY